MIEKTPNSKATSEDIPATLSKAIELQTQGTPASLEGVPVPLSEEAYATLREKVLADIARDCDKNPYHNRAHTEGVERRFLELAKLAGFSPSETQIGAIAALFHDYGHAGQTVRQETSVSLPQKDLSNEEFAALMVDTFLADKMPKDVIAFVQSAILGTSFGQSSGPYARPYKPQNALEKLVAFADIANFTSTLDEWMEENFNVLRETPSVNTPKSYDEMIIGRNKFLDFVSSKLEDVAPILGPENTAQYQVSLEKLRDAVNSLETKEKYEPLYEALLAEKLNRGLRPHSQ